MFADSLTDSPMLETVGGYMRADALTNAPLLETVDGDMFAEALTNAPMLETVGGHMIAEALTDAPRLETVGGYMRANALTETPRLETVGGEMRAKALTNAPKLTKVSGWDVNPIVPAVPISNNPDEMALAASLEMPLPPTVITALKEGNFAEAMELMAKTKDFRTARLARTLLNAAVNPKVVVVKNLKNEEGNAVAGLYDPRTNTIRLDSVTGMSAHTLIHETGHAALSHVLDNKNHPVTKQMQQLFDAVVPSLDTTYGAENLQEFAAEALSNPEFRGKLNSLTPAGSNISAWQRFQNIVGNFFRKLFGVSGKPTESAMDRVDRLIDQILSPAPESRDAGSLYAIAQSKTKTTKFLDSAAEFISKLPKMNQERADKLHRFITESPKETVNAVLSILPLNLLSDAAKKHVRGAETINSLNNQKSADIANRNEEITVLVTRANKWAANASKSTLLTFNNVVYDSTTEEVDPTRARTYYEAKPDKDGNISLEAAADATKKLAAYDRIYAEYTKLEPNAKAMYVLLRNAYKEMYKRVKESLSSRIDEALENTPDNVKIRNKLFAKLLSRGGIDPYFPLTREGNFWLAYNFVDSNGQRDRAVQAFETPRARDRARVQLENDPKRKEQLEASAESGLDKKAVDALSKVENYSNIKNIPYNKFPPTSFVNDVIKILKENNASEASIEDVVNLFVNALPETSFAKGFQQRKNTPGFDRDAISAISKKLFATSSQIANMEYAPKFNAVMKDMRDDILEMGRSGKDISYARIYYEEFKKHVALINNPTITNLSRIFTSIGFNWLLGANVSSAFVQLLQVPMVTLPYLSGAYNKNYADVFSEITAAYGEFMQTGTRKTTQAFGGAPSDTETRKAMLSLANVGPGHPLYKKYETLINTLKENNFLGSSMTQDILQVPNTIGLGQKVNFYTSWMHHHSDQINRQVTAIATYNLELAKLKAEGKKGVDAQIEAANEAVYVTEMTQGSTSATSAPRIAQNSLGRVLFMFKRYGVMMLYLQGKTLRGALAGESRGVKRAAMQQFAGMTGMAALFAGLQGLPFFGIAALVYNLFKDDDEDDLEMATRRMFGPVATYGPFSYITGADISQRVSATDLLVREMRTGDRATNMTILMEQLLGPVYGIGSRMERGFTLMGDGYLARGAEQAMPVALANLLKSYRFATEGAQTLRGDPITSDIGLGAAGLQLFGFSPYDVARQNEINSRLKGFDKYVTGKQSKLARKYYTAGRMGDYEEQAEIRKELQELFAKHPGLGSVQDYLQRSMESHRRSTIKMINGITVNEKLRSELLRYAEDLQ